MTVDKIYEAIGNNINTVIKEDWQKAILNIEVLGGMTSNTGTYINDQNHEKQIDVEEFDFQLTFDLIELHEITTEGGNNKWNRAVFTLFSTGKFDMEFIWDQELQDKVERLSEE
jgi:hypothetical protein